MTNALIEIRRVPLPGKEFILAEGVKKSLEATGKSGIVTATSASSHLQTRDVTTAITGLTLSEITEIETAVSNSRIALLYMCFVGMSSVGRGSFSSVTGMMISVQP